MAHLASNLVIQGFDSTHKESPPCLHGPGHPKIRPEHLDRHALIYVRQSTPMQVRDNIASTARQYDLARSADRFGWPKQHIQVIDQDQGHSGASAIGRDGFQYLMAEVCLGHVGAVLSLEASRLARSNSDWCRLIEICSLTDTLVIDEDGVYDPTQYNDRLLLGIKGTMSEAELHWLRSRLLGGKQEKARAGQLRFRLPTGLVYDPAGQIVLDPDEQVQHAIRLVFDTFERVGAALGVVQYFAENHLTHPDPALREDPRRSTDLATLGPWARPGHPPQSGVRGHLRLRADQDPHRRLARRGAARQRADAADRRRRTGRTSSTTTIPPTSPGANSRRTSSSSSTTAHHSTKIIAGRSAKVRRCSRASSCAAGVDGG